MCETHEQGLTAVKVIEASGYAVHHIFGPKAERQRRKQRFWPDAPASAAARWIRSKAGSQGRGARHRNVGGALSATAYVAMTRVKGDPLGRRSLVTVVNSVPALATFEMTFVENAASWPAPLAALRVG